MIELKTRWGKDQEEKRRDKKGKDKKVKYQLVPFFVKIDVNPKIWTGFLFRRLGNHKFLIFPLALAQGIV